MHHALRAGGRMFLWRQIDQGRVLTALRLDLLEPGVEVFDLLPGRGQRIPGLGRDGGRGVGGFR
jgi:hypothetical protein